MDATLPPLRNFVLPVRTGGMCCTGGCRAVCACAAREGECATDQRDGMGWDGWMEGWTCVDGWMDGWMDGYVYGWMDVCMHVGMDVCMDIWMYACMDGWLVSMDGWTDVYVCDMCV